MAELTDNDSSPVIQSGPSTHLDNFEEVSTNVSEFAQVIFNNVQECYLPGSDLQCNYTLTSAIRPQSRDWIGVFKVGWTSTRQYRAFEWAPNPTQLTDGDEWTHDITFKAYYLPKDEDCEYYQLCYIDAAGKMRGASTPFQFLEQSADDFVQVLDDSMDILMIHNKSEYCVEELKRVQEEKHEIEEECKSLKEKVIALGKELQDAKDQLDSITQEYEACAHDNKSMDEKLKSMTCELAEAKERVTNLSEEAGNYESSLQQTEGAFMEVVNRELALRNKLDELEKQHNQVMSDRTSLKSKLELSEKNNTEMCEEIDNLKQLLSHSNETHQEVRESEVRIKEQFLKMQQELQQSSMEKEQLQMMECRFSSAESSRVILAKELDSLKMVQEKLSKDLVAAKTEKESLKVALDRQTKEMKEEKKRVQLQSHQNREKTALLQEQISALKDGIQQLAQEKEMATKGTKGSQEAQQIATKDLKDKVRRTQFQCKEEVRRRAELQKKMHAMEATYRDENQELKREIEELRLRLQMGAEEYKKKYSECRQLEAKLEKRKVMKESSQTMTASTDSTSEWKDVEKNMSSIAQSGEGNGYMRGTQTLEVVSNSQGSQVVSEQTSQAVQAISSQATQGSQITNQASQAIQATTGIQASNLTTQASQATTNQATQGSQAAGTNKEMGTQSGLPAVAVKMEGALQRPASRDDTFDLKEMHEQMCSLSKELHERKKEIDSFKRMYQEEREKASHLERVWQLKYQSIESKNTELQDKNNKMLNDYTNMKHSYESVKFDMESQRRSAPAPQEPSDRPKQFVNPYAQQTSPSPPMQSGNPSPLDSVYGNPYGEGALPSALMEVSIDSMNLGSIRYPPDMVEDAVLSDASDSIPPALLPEPLQPDVLPEGKIAAIKMMSSKLEGKNDCGMVQTEQTDDDREDAQFVDAQEFPEEVMTSPTPDPMAPPMPTCPPPPPEEEPKKCPECVIEFPYNYPEEDFVRHVQRHFAKLCPVCSCLLDPQISQVDFQVHVERCIMSRN
ncbi:tax1-binding protein 1 homolog [Lytechinus pictus]|uniref:tax1-binding protein 1 homolog n=1 Tax=Lytechinus pictus TaxID=7653 RepID=UPI0030B9D271